MYNGIWFKHLKKWFVKIWDRIKYSEKVEINTRHIFSEFFFPFSLITVCFLEEKYIFKSFTLISSDILSLKDMVNLSNLNNDYIVKVFSIM